MTAGGPLAREVRPECQFDLHQACKTGDVVTCYGDVVFTVRCDCTCHTTLGAVKETAR